MLEVKQKTSIEITVSDGNTFGSSAISPAVVLAKTLITNNTVRLVSGTSTASPRDSSFRIDLATGTITARRNGTTGTIIVQVDLVEFTAASNITVARYTTSSTSTDFNVAITTVGSQSNSWIMSEGMEVDDGTYGDGETFRLNFNGSSQVRVRRGATASANTTAFAVVESSDCTTINSNPILSGTNTTHLISGLDPTTDVCFITGTQASTPLNADDRHVFTVESGQVRFQSVNSNQWAFSIFAVTFLPAANVNSIQHTGRQSFTGASDTVAITSVDISKAWTIPAASWRGLLSTTNGDNQVDDNGGAISLLDSTNVQCVRNAASGTMHYGAQVIEFAGSVIKKDTLNLRGNLKGNLIGGFQ